MHIRPPVLRLKRPTEMQSFRWSIFLFSLFVSASVMFLFGLAMDNTLRLFGIGISSWFDSLWDSFLGVFFATFIAPVFWRIGLVTFPQYLLGAFALAAPITIISVLVLSRFYNVSIEVPGINSAAFPDQSFAVSAYVRLIRAVIFIPVFLWVFYWVFHICFGMAPKSFKHD